MRGRKPSVTADDKAIASTPRVPAWLSKDAQAEYRRIMPGLVERRILTHADMASVENFCIAVGRAREIERQIQKAGEITPAMFRMQNAALQTARQLAAELGLTPVSRSRPAIRDDNPDDELAEYDL
jgi:P27 family predicted phage terminase small subunit